jgi:serine/threonine protein kinase
MGESSLGEFHIVRELGRGRGGTVYLAEKAGHPGKVALKILPPEEGEDGRARLDRCFSDARGAAALHHPGIAAVVDQGIVEGKPYLASEYLEGVTLRAWVTTPAAAEPSARLSIARQVAAAGGAAHERRIVHGALRPENVFLVGGEVDKVKVTDFGLGRLLRGATVDDLVYASPERCRRPERNDINDDVYAFGCLLYELVCGRVPFAYRDRDALVAAHLGEPPPSPRSAAEWVPPALDRLILAALCKSAGGRPRSLAVMEQVLGQIASGQPEPLTDARFAGREPTAPRLTPLGHVHLRPRELRMGRPSPADSPVARRTPLGRAHLHLRNLVVDDRPVDLPASDAPAAPALQDAPESPVRGSRRLWWLLGAAALLVLALLAARGFRARSLDAAALPATATPLKP